MKEETRLYTLTVLLIIFFANAFSSNADSRKSQSDRISKTASPVIVITLERTVCHGTCPVYKLIIVEDGAVEYEGISFVKIEGKRKSNISREKLDELVAEFNRTNYFSLKDRYFNQEDGCKEFYADAPSAITSISLNGKRKAINHYYGCVGAPEELTALEKKIDEIVDSAQWIK